MAVGFGIDFGTSNSAIAMAMSDGRVHPVRWNVPSTLSTEGESESSTLPTVIFAPDYDREFHVGFDAIRQYLFTGLDGRFMQSIKAFLPSPTFTGTVIKNRHYSIEELIAIFLRRARIAAEEQLGVKLEGRIVLGRPARFSLDAEEDRLAETRLLEAAKLSGLPEVTLLIEPIAAAIAYEATLEREEVVFVADLGGGTSDFTVMRVGPSQRDRDRSESVLASGGVPVAGDALDGEIVRARLFAQFGYGSEYRAFGAPTAVPHWIFHKLLRWNHVSFLKSKKYLEFLREVSKTSDRPEDIERLIELVDSDLSYVLFRAVERAKRGVQSQPSAEISDEEHSLPVREELTVEQFADAIAERLGDIRRNALDTLERAGLEPSRVDAVFMTGGTSLVSPIRAEFSRIFGAEKPRGRGTFTSVVDGLARASVMDGWEARARA
jgi:hypothetical chaperone protein